MMLAISPLRNRHFIQVTYLHRSRDVLDVVLQPVKASDSLGTHILTVIKPRKSHFTIKLHIIERKLGKFMYGDRAPCAYTCRYPNTSEYRSSLRCMGHLDGKVFCTYGPDPGPVSA